MSKESEGRACYLHIEFCGQIPSAHGISFLGADVPASSFVPFAMVQFAVSGRTQKDCLRLDIDKKVFLDHLQDDPDLGKLLTPPQVQFIDDSAPQIAEFLGKKLHPEARVMELVRQKLELDERIGKIELEFDDRTLPLWMEIGEIDRELIRLLNPEMIDPADFEPK